MNVASDTKQRFALAEDTIHARMVKRNNQRWHLCIDDESSNSGLQRKQDIVRRSRSFGEDMNPIAIVDAIKSHFHSCTRISDEGGGIGRTNDNDLFERDLCPA